MKIRLIVPAATRENPWPREYHKEIADIAGGFTTTQAIGGWKDDSGRLVVEPVMVFDCYCNPESILHAGRVRDFTALAKRIARELHQDCVYLEIDGVVALVKE